MVALTDNNIDQNTRNVQHLSTLVNNQTHLKSLSNHKLV